MEPDDVAPGYTTERMSRVLQVRAEGWGGSRGIKDGGHMTHVQSVGGGALEIVVPEGLHRNGY